jgi:hypothetical protein
VIEFVIGQGFDLTNYRGDARAVAWELFDATNRRELC